MIFVANETHRFAALSETPAAFQMGGGLYGVTVAADAGGGNVTLQRLSGDATTYVTVLTAITAPGYSRSSFPARRHSRPNSRHRERRRRLRLQFALSERRL